MNTRSIPDGNSKHENPFLEPDLAARYEQWYSGPRRQADLLEKRLLQRMLHQLGTARTILEIGCGTGHFTRWMRSLNYDVVGLDNSPPMLEQALSVNGGVSRLSRPARTPDQPFGRSESWPTRTSRHRSTRLQGQSAPLAAGGGWLYCALKDDDPTFVTPVGFPLFFVGNSCHYAECADNDEIPAFSALLSRLPSSIWPN